jgi:hypothetical protein
VTHRSFLLLLLIIAMVSCHNRGGKYLGPSITGLSFQASSAIIGLTRDSLAVRVIATNNSDRMVKIEFSQCSQLGDITAVVAANGRRWNSRIWETRRLDRGKTHAGSEQLCVGGELVGSFPPGARHTYSLVVPIGEILGDSLIAAIYRVTAALDINGRRVRNLPAGEVEISLRPPPNTR